MDCTARLGLPFLSPGQAQKELYHNEALQRLDMLVAASAEWPPLPEPPERPEPGRCFIVGRGATGEWAGKDDALAGYTDGGWRFVDAPQGMQVYVRSSGLRAERGANGWEIGQLHCSSLVVEGQQVIGRRADPVALPEGGKTVDLEARETIRHLLDAMARHGVIEM